MSRPIHNPVSFGAFARSMMNSSLDDINTYYDSDGEEVDLADTFADGENSDAESSDDRDTLLNYNSADDAITNENPNLEDITSRATDLVNRQLVDYTLKSLEDITSFVQPTLNEQPLSTQTILASQATDIFKSYAEHGSEARLSAGILRFLQGGEIVRAKGRGGRDPEQDRRLRLAPVDTATRIDNIYGELGNCGDKILLPKTRDLAIQSSEESKRKKRHGCILVPDKTGDKEGLRLNTIASANAQHSIDSMGERIQQRSTSNESWNSESTLTSEHTQAANTTILSANTSIRPATSFSDTENHVRGLSPCLPAPARLGPPTCADKIQASLRLANYQRATEQKTYRPYHVETLSKQVDSVPQNLSSSLWKHAYSVPYSYSLTTDDETHSQLPYMPFEPIRLDISFSKQGFYDPVSNSIKKIQFPPGYLDALNRIFHLYNAEARYLLSYFVAKYSPGPTLGVAELDDQETKVEPPHALFRLAITQLLQSKVDGIVRKAVDDDLGLGPQERNLLRSVFEQVGVTEVCTRAHRKLYRGGDLNIDDATDEDEDMSEDPESSTSLTDDEYYARISSYDGSDVEDDLLDRCYDENAQVDPDTQSSSILDSFIRAPRSLRQGRPSTLVEDLVAGRVYVETGLNVLEKEILARSVGTNTEVVEKFWVEMRKKRRAWGALKGWCRMMEGRRVSIAKKNGTW